LAGLIGPGERKSIKPLATRMAPDRYDRLHHHLRWDVGRRTDRGGISSSGLKSVVQMITRMPIKGDWKTSQKMNYAD
jgi:hypothetical protein